VTDTVADADATASDPADADLSAAPLVAAYRHDVHKLRGRTHGNAHEAACGVPVNEPVPRNADRDAALLSRPRGEPEQTLDRYAGPRRISLLTGEFAGEAGTLSSEELAPLVTPTDSEVLHRRWLASAAASRCSESPFYPYTSAKVHTLLTAALLDTYRSGFDFHELFLEVQPGTGIDAVCPAPGTLARADAVTPIRTVLVTPQLVVTVTGDPSGPAARLGTVPARCWADVWGRLPEHPLDVSEHATRVLDAQLRRIRAVSTALQYVEDVHRWRGWGDATTATDTNADGPLGGDGR
jgi:hypothetical protein